MSYPRNNGIIQGSKRILKLRGAQSVPFKMSNQFRDPKRKYNYGIYVWAKKYLLNKK